MIETLDALKEEYIKAAETDFTKNSVAKNEVYAAFFFGLTITMSGTYGLPLGDLTIALDDLLKTTFGFTDEHAKEFIAFLLQSMQPRVNPKFYAVIRQGMDAFYDIEDGYTGDIKTTLLGLVDSILGTTECDVKF